MPALKLSRPLVVFDIESTGTSARKDRIIELAAVKVFPDWTEETKTWLLNPTISIPPETTAIHGITDEIVASCPTFADKAAEIFAFFDGCDLSGFNADRFDIPCLEEEFARSGFNFAPSQRLHIDVQRIFHKKEPRDLTAAVKFYLGRAHEGAHGAEADAKATLAVLKAQMERYPDLPSTAAEMDEYLVPRDPLNADRMGTFAPQTARRKIDHIAHFFRGLPHFPGSCFCHPALILVIHDQRNSLQRTSQVLGNIFQSCPHKKILLFEN